MKTEYLKLLNEFANSHSLSTNIEVNITDHHKSFKPRFEGADARYEEANLLSSIIVGAENFCYFLQRNGYTIKGIKVGKSHKIQGKSVKKSQNHTLKGAK